MNNKGFTLIEMLAVVALIALIMTIAVNGVSNAIEKSRKKSEELFAARVNNVIDDYIDYMTLNNSKFIINPSYETLNFEKCYGYKGNKCRNNDLKNVTANLIKKNDNSEITLQDLINTKLIEENSFINPNTKKKCKNLDTTKIYLFKDSDYVYYYYTDIKDSCNITEEDNINIINTLPDQFCSNEQNKLIMDEINSDICDDYAE